MLTKIRIYYIAAIAWLLVCTWLLTLPGAKIPTENIFTRLHFDKLVHIILFFILVLVWCWSVSGKHSDGGRLKKIFLVIAILALVYGIGMEFVQRFLVKFRTFDGLDILADGAGCVFGLVLSNRRYIKK